MHSKKYGDLWADYILSLFSIGLITFSLSAEDLKQISEDFGFVLESLVCFHVDHAATFYKNNETSQGQK